MTRLNILEFPVPVTIKIVANLIDTILKTNDRIPNQHISHFHSRAVPDITIEAYLTRILKFTPFSNEVLLCLLVYFDRIAKRDKHFTICSLNIHRLLITSIVIASKFTSDVYYANRRYAKVGGIALHELNKLEMEFLFLCNFKLLVRLEDLQSYGNQLLTHSLTQPTIIEQIANMAPEPIMPIVSHQPPQTSQAGPLTPPYDPPVKKHRSVRNHPYAR
ncbi:hypothetical protein DFQ28_011214, partial [Apophysomyces sp. BC1034]